MMLTMRRETAVPADLATTTFGPIEKYVAANDNVPTPKGFFAGLSAEQQAAALAYRGEENHGHIGLQRAEYANSSAGGFVSQRIGDWLQTFTGRRYYPIDPRPEEVFIEDIAHSLSLQCRYACHCIQHYSVAEHSVHVARWLLRQFGPVMALHGLLHDATEAYVVDVPRPLKPSLTNYKEIEARNWAVIARRFSLAKELPAEVHEADNRIVGDELVNMRPMAWHARYNEPLGVKIGCWSPAAAEEEFLATFDALTDRRAAA